MFKRLCVLVVVGLLAASSEARADNGEKWDPATIGVQSVGGAAAGVGLSSLIYVATRQKQCEGWDCYNFGPVLLSVVGGIGGGIAGIQLIGDGMDGTGTLTGTLVGTGVGVVGSIVSVSVLNKLKVDSGVAYLAAFALPIVAGGVIGYHASAEDKAGVTARIPLFLGSF